MDSLICSTSNSLCRICLEDGATFAIFDSDVNEESICKKIKKCLKAEVEDIKGYPQFICGTCNITLETIHNFIDKFVQTTKVLETGLLKNVKQETLLPLDEYSDNDYSDIDVKFKPDLISCDTNFNDTELECKFVEPLVLKIKREYKPKDVIPKKKGNIRPKNRTNRILTSMLEGEFSWDGDNWSLNSNKKPLTRAPNCITVKRKPKKETVKKLKVIKLKSELQSDTSKLCDLCGEVFKNPTSLRYHKQTKHEQNPLQCPKCPWLCPSKCALARHLKKKHDGSKDFICSICGALFVFNGELTSHIKRVHQKHLLPKKMFKCQFCDKMYKCQKSATIHERSVHTGHRPAVCTVCNSTFYHEDYLREHMRLHTGETPFKCPICGRGYAQRCNMKSHLRNHKITDITPESLSKLKPSYLKYLKDYQQV